VHHELPEYLCDPHERIFGIGVDVRESCEFVVTHESGRVDAIQSPFPPAGKCRILRLAETDIPRAEFVQGEYVLLVESVTTIDGNCRAQLAALIVARDGRVRASPATPRTSACGAAERKDFEILRYRSRNQPDRPR
jgi:hypothetical protein